MKAGKPRPYRVCNLMTVSYLSAYRYNEKSEGYTMEELVDNLQDAIQGWLEVANEIQKPDPISQIIEIAV